MRVSSCLLQNTTNTQLTLAPCDFTRRFAFLPKSPSGFPCVAWGLQHGQWTHMLQTWTKIKFLHLWSPATWLILQETCTWFPWTKDNLHFQPWKPWRRDEWNPGPVVPLLQDPHKAWRGCGNACMKNFSIEFCKSWILGIIDMTNMREQLTVNGPKHGIGTFPMCSATACVWRWWIKSRGCCGIDGASSLKLTDGRCSGAP